MESIKPSGHEKHQQVYAQQMSKVLQYIEGNIEGDLSLNILSRVAGFSRFHFHRQFLAFTDMTLARFIKLLRLQRASKLLVFARQLAVTDIALMSGYENTESFSRAFRECYGTTPSQFRSQPIWKTTEITEPLKRLKEKNVNTEINIVHFPETRVAAAEFDGPESEPLTATMRLIQWRQANGVPPNKGKTYGLHYPPETDGHQRIDVCVSYDGEIGPNPQGIVSKVIPAGRCACIRHHGSREWMPEVDYLYKEWLPSSGEVLRDYPAIFHYINVGPGVEERDMLTDIYLPLV
ncbi:MAG: AraC family transcriptional regulator [Pseudomonadales bacterium]|nr:AraC family transcriptional regulator [Pseudomonadales bacterium]